MKFIYDFMHDLPGLTALLTFVVGAVAMLLVMRRYFPLQNRALDALVKTHEAHEKLLDDERNFYRNRTHDQRNELQACHSQIAILEARPNLATMENLLERQAKAMEGIRDTMRTQQLALEEHMKDDHKAFELLFNKMTK